MHESEKGRRGRIGNVLDKVLKTAQGYTAARQRITCSASGGYRLVMAHWNFRVMLKDGRVAMHEVLYADDESINGYTADPVYPQARDMEGLAEELERYRCALSEPVLDFAALGAATEERPSRQAEPGAAADRSIGSGSQ
jgi:hypothetical protein